MKKNLWFFVSMLMMLWSCNKKTSEDGIAIGAPIQKDGIAYTLDTSNSRIEWKGYKILKTEQTSHFGSLSFNDGLLTVKDGKLQYGLFQADVKSIKNLDLQGDASLQAKLEEHLKSKDFFDIEKYPNATFEITRINPASTGDFNTILEGDLTIKNIKKNIRVFANVMVNDGEVIIASEPTDLKRKDFGLNVEIPLENGILHDDFTIQIMVKAKRK